MSALCPDELDCDFAAVYGVYDRQTLPVRKAAAFAAGLPENSRVFRALSGNRFDTTDYLIALCADALRTLVWMQTKDGRRGRNRPPSVAEAMTAKRDAGDETMTFADGEAFDRAWRS